jgi:glycosyltransferase involved in cell wall biosynthesis
MLTDNLHIIIINDFAYINGGAGQIALNSAISLAKKGYSVTLFTAVLPIMPELCTNNLKVVCTNQHEILNNPNRLKAAIQGIWNFKSARLMSQLLQTLNPSHTIIHVHSWTKALSSSIIRKAIRKGFKVVCTLHDYFTACPNGGFFNYPENEICHLKPLSIECLLENCDARSYSQKLWRFGRQLVQKKIGLIPRKIHHFITVSKFSRSILEPFLPLNAKIYEVENPIDITKGESTNVEKNTSFIFVGRLSKEKGPDLFAKAASILEYEAIFVGDGELRRNVLQIYSSAKVTGWLLHNRVIEQLKSARALIFPSKCYETQGMVVLEAASLGIPAIVADTSAAREMVINGETGLWFKGGNSEDLIEKMNILNTPDKAKKMGQKAYDVFWSNPPTMEKHVEELEKVYKDILY